MTTPEPTEVEAARDAVLGRFLDKRGPTIYEDRVLDAFEAAIRRDERERMATPVPHFVKVNDTEWVERIPKVAPAGAIEEALWETLRHNIESVVHDGDPELTLEGARGAIVYYVSGALEALLAHREARLREALGGTP